MYDIAVAAHSITLGLLTHKFYFIPDRKIKVKIILLNPIQNSNSIKKNERCRVVKGS